MAMTQKISDVGWMYHAPSKAKEASSMPELPPASQIPGLNEFPEGYYPIEEPKKMLIHEHDSPYIRLAKQGGRSDLLRHRTPVNQNKEPKAYPRVNWFYQDDIKLENDLDQNAPSTGSYEFNLPEYMVHEEYRPHGDNSNAISRNILSRDPTNVFQREGHGATDKTLKIEEATPAGYGVRKQRYRMPVSVKTPPPLPGQARIKRVALPEEEKPAMAKLLSFGYARDWAQHRDENKNGISDAEQHNEIQCNENSAINDVQLDGAKKPPRIASHGRRATPGATTQHRRQKALKDDEKPDIFSLNRSDAFARKTSSRRQRSELQPAMIKPK